MYRAHGYKCFDFAEAAIGGSIQDGLQCGPVLLIVVEQILHLVRDNQLEGLSRQIYIEHFIVAHQAQMWLRDILSGKTNESHSQLLCNNRCTFKLYNDCSGTGLQLEQQTGTHNVQRSWLTSP